MRAGDGAKGIGAGDDRQAEGERHAGIADPQMGDAGGEDGAAATPQDQPECSDKLRDQPACHAIPPLTIAGTEHGRALSIKPHPVAPRSETARDVAVPRRAT